ncbi:MAG TPA: oligosaccharide flippase family protein [Alphaproteobacteria bacterium]|jgi:O-antigen/teichoic acid export membrane protein
MRDVVSSLTATALIQVSNIASGVLLARFLQPDGRGELAAVILWPSVIAAVGIFGLHEAVAYHAARRRHGAGEILRSSLLLGAVLSLILLPVGAAVVNLVFAGQPGDVRAAAFLYLAFIPLNFFGLFVVGLFQGRLRFTEWNLLRTSVQVFYVLFILLFYFTGMGDVHGFALASLLSNVAMIALAVALHRRVDWRSGAAPAATAEPPAWRALTRYGISVHFGATAAIVAERLDQMIISVMLPAADLGLFVIAMTLSRLPLVLATTLATVSFPKIAGAADEAGKAHIFGRYARATVLVTVPTAAMLAVLMPWLLPLFFGPAFAAATPVAWVLLISAVPISLKAMMGAGLKACDRGWLVGQAETATLALSAASLVALVPAYGLMGAAVASIISQGGALVFMTIRARRILGVPAAVLLLPRRADVALVVDTMKELRQLLVRSPRPAR